ncbi:LpxL/LpxP family acyltransferase [Parapedobacter indicus]|uniref:Lipid A biosynthesis acyltransferase n=1 Tax=Parapedobacter indicus TaxID=1477437 RepID=A0A1I3TF19_9SPHI|nr:hypothetical protein [Parapedobacter indicus]PPK99503.1 lipid A biosynthesis acyltransferase [Parapedobacter indicus]SFJ69768.1 lipid A biosynthesis acyltransferase [Parapedobacter indicus]
METEDYQKRASYIRKLAATMNPYETMNRLYQFTFLSANLINFLPTMAYSQHLSMFGASFFNQQMNRLDYECFADELPYGTTGWTEATIDRLKATPGIICTLHMGAYRLINYLLARSGVPFAILMSARASQQQGEDFKRLFQAIQTGQPDAKLAIIEAESRGTIWQLMGLLKRGYNLLMYLDGYSGQPTQQDQLVTVPFLAQHVLLRKGAAFLANRLEKPLYPILCVRQPNYDVRILEGTSLYGSRTADETWPELAMNHLFAFFGTVIQHHPAQWENWFFLHQQVNVKQLYAGQTNNFFHSALDPADFGIFGLHGKHYLLRKRGYESFEISKNVFHEVWKLWTKKD